jgi:DNA-binding CsgD family transcriptional regulator
MKTDKQTIIFSLYDAVGNEGAWSGVVKTLSEHLDANIGILVFIGLGKFEQSVYANYNYSAKAVQSYSDYWWQHNLWLQTATKRNLIQKGNILIGSELIPTEELKKTPFYTENLVHIPMEHLLGVILSDGQDVTETPMILNFFRAPGAIPFDENDRQALGELYPHIHRAFTMHWQWRNMQEQLSTFHNSLDSMDFGVIYVDAVRRVSHANQAAHRIANNILLPKLPALGAISDLIDSAANGQGGAAMINEHRIMVLALPVSKPVSTISGETRASVMLLLVGDDGHHASAVAFLCSAFTLSKAESRLIPLLLLGKTPVEMAESLNLKLNTIRSQLSNIFSKTGTTRQQELIRLLGRVPAVVENKNSHT